MSTFDLIVRGGLVVEGDPQRAPFHADVAVLNGRIAAIGDLSAATSARTVDAEGLVVAPGFIDVHTHIERALLGGQHRYAAASMGVTTILTGPDGFGWTGLEPQAASEMWDSTAFANGSDRLPRNWRDPDDYLADFAGNLPINIAAQAPHNEIRLAIMDWHNGAAEQDQIAAQVRRLESWFEAGAVGLSLGLDYQPGAFASYEELRALSAVAAARGGPVAAHLRFAALGQDAAWEELMRLNLDTGAAVHVSHSAVDSTTQPLLDRCEQLEIDLTFESYLYPAGCTHLTMMLPLELQQGPPQAIAERLRQPRLRERALAHLVTSFEVAQRRGERVVTVATPSGHGTGIDLLAFHDGDAEAAAVSTIDLITREYPFVLALYHRGWSDSLREQIFEQTALHPRLIVASDGVYHGSLGHPRGYGCFPSFVRRFVRAKPLLTLSQAIYRMSGAAADRFGIPDRGYLESGMAADFVLFQPDSLSDEATWERPFTPATGVVRVLVGGEDVVIDGAPSGNLPGRVLRKA